MTSPTTPLPCPKLLTAVTVLTLLFSAGLQGGEIRVTVWDERQPKQAKAYDNFLGNEIAAYLKSKPGLKVRSFGLDDPHQGISDATPRRYRCTHLVGSCPAPRDLGCDRS